jgi:hypothetical protein
MSKFKLQIAKEISKSQGLKPKKNSNLDVAEEEDESFGAPMPMDGELSSSEEEQLMQKKRKKGNKKSDKQTKKQKVTPIYKIVLLLYFF